MGFWFSIAGMDNIDYALCPDSILR
jgi:hypothetical protein